MLVWLAESVIKIYKVDGRIIHANERLIRNRKRICSECREWIPLTDYHIKKRNGRLIFASYCKYCTTEVMIRYRRKKGVGEKKLRRKKVDNEGLIKYRCCRCKRYKYLPDFWKLASSPDGIQYSCIECERN